MYTEFILVLLEILIFLSLCYILQDKTVFVESSLSYLLSELEPHSNTITTTVTTTTTFNTLRAEEEFKPEEDSLPPYTPPAPNTRAIIDALDIIADIPPSYQETWDISDLRIPIDIVTHDVTFCVASTNNASDVSDADGDNSNNGSSGTSSSDGSSCSSNGSSSNISNDCNANVNTNINNDDMNRPTSDVVVHSHTMNDMVSIPVPYVTPDICSIPIIVIN